MCDHCGQFKYQADLIKGYNYLGNPMRVCGPCIKNQEKTLMVTGWMGVIVIAAIFAWHLFLSAEIEQGRQFICNSFRKAAVWCEAGEQFPCGFQVHPIPGAR